MGKLIRPVSKLFYNFVFPLLLLTVGGECLFAQLNLNNLQPFVLEVSDASDLSGVNELSWAPADTEISSLFGVPVLNTEETGDGHFLLNRNEGDYLAFSPQGAIPHELMAFEISNQSGSLIEHLQIAFDVAIRSSTDSRAELFLSYEYGSLDGRQTLIRSGQFEGRADSWQMASLNTILENLMLEEDESVRVRIGFRTGESESDAIALHRLEIHPEAFQYSQSLSIGELVITEIYPGAPVEEEALHYLEIYNTTFHTIDLRGLSIETGSDLYRIREALNVEPYDMVVIANRDLEATGFSPNIVIEGFHMPSHGGMVELAQGGQRIVRSAYDEQIGNHAWELRSVLNALDGYASINDFEITQHQLSEGLSGSPGSSGSTELIYTHELSDEGDWIMISAPGILLTNLNAEQSYWTGKSVDSDRVEAEIPAGTGILKRFSSSRTDVRRLMARGADDRSISELALPEGENPWLLLGNPFRLPITLDQVRAVDGEFSSRTAQLWDEREKTFKILNPNSVIEPWQAFIMRNEDAGSVRFERDEFERARTYSEPENPGRFIEFELRYTGDRRDSTVDRAAVLYFHEEGRHGRDRLDMEKLWPVFSKSESRGSSILYFIRRQPQGPVFLAKDARPYQPEGPFEADLGHMSYNVSGTHELSWGDLEGLPDEWELKLTDLNSGTTVNMRDVRQYTFDSAPDALVNSGFSDTPAIHPLISSDPHERFTLSVNPNPDRFTEAAEEEEEEEEERENVELYQNYPNPFRTATTIEFYLPEESAVVVSVYNVVGQQVAMLLDDVYPGGQEYSVAWDASDMPSGIYICRLEMGNRVLTRKMTLIK